MMRYNRRWTIYSSFGLMVLGMVMVLASGILSLAPDPSILVPSGVSRRVVRNVISLVIGVDFFLSMMLMAYVVLQNFAMLHTEIRDTQKDVSVNTAEIRKILERERERYGRWLGSGSGSGIHPSPSPPPPAPGPGSA
jgi:hypothetical protein